MLQEAEKEEDWGGGGEEWVCFRRSECKVQEVRGVGIAG